MPQARLGRRKRYEAAVVSITTDDEAKRPRRASRRLVVVGVIFYCVLAWAAIFQLVQLGLALTHQDGPSYAQRSAGADADN